MASDPRVIDLLGKLLAKQRSLEDIGTEASLNEASVTATKIAEHCLRHRIGLEQVAMESGGAKRARVISTERYEYDGTESYRAAKRVAWEVRLASSVSRAHSCRILLGIGYFLFVGEEEDRQVAMVMFRILRREVTEACTRGYRTARAQGRNTRGFISSFFYSAITNIAQRYQLMQQRVEASTGSTALVRVIDSTLDKAVEDFSGGRPGVITKQRGSYNRHGIEVGGEFGNSVSLNARAVGTSGSPAKQLGGGQ